MFHFLHINMVTFLISSSPPKIQHYCHQSHTHLFHPLIIFLYSHLFPSYLLLLHLLNISLLHKFHQHEQIHTDIHTSILISHPPNKHNDLVDCYNKTLSDLLNKHAPLKSNLFPNQAFQPMVFSYSSKTEIYLTPS